MAISNPRGFVIQTLWSPNRSRQIPWIKKKVFLAHHTGNGVTLASLGSVINWFMSTNSGVSADFVVDRNGTIVRMVPRGWIGWHAGICTWRGAPYRLYNHLSVGVELVNDGSGHDPYPQIQLEAMAYVYAVCQAESPTLRYPRRHGDVAIPLGRKVDPAGLGIEEIYTAIHNHQPEVLLG